MHPTRNLYFWSISFFLVISLVLGGQGKQAGALCHSSVKPSTKTIFLVRHAEKMKGQGSDPELTEAGQERAERLAYLLADVGISKIYSSDYIRTQSTARPLAEQLRLEVESYNPRALEELATALKETDAQNILVVGHSNTTPKLANALLGQTIYEALDESVYTKVFVVSLQGENSHSYLLQY